GFCRLEVKDQVELGRLFDWNVGWLRATQDLVDLLCGTPAPVCPVGSIGHQSSRFDILTASVNRRQSCVLRQNIDRNAVVEYERVGCDIERVHATLKSRDSRRDFFGLSDFALGNFESERA